MKESFSPDTQENTSEQSSEQMEKAIVQNKEKNSKNRFAVFALLLGAMAFMGCNKEQQARLDNLLGTHTASEKPETSKDKDTNQVHDLLHDVKVGRKSNVKFENVENLFPGLSEADIQRMCDECLPEHGRPRSLTFINRREPLPAQYGMTGYSAATTDPRGNVVFYEGSHRQDFQTFLRCFFHESIHVYVNNLNPAQKHRLNEAILARLNSSDRAQFSYVNQINNSDYKVQAGEYIAEAGQAYFRGLPLPDKDIQMVQELIALADPSFDLAHSRTIVAELAKKIGQPGTQIPPDTLVQKTPQLPPQETPQETPPSTYYPPQQPPTVYVYPPQQRVYIRVIRVAPQPQQQPPHHHRR